MTIMNKNLNSKLEELHGFQAIDTNVALTEIRSQLHELTKSVESCQVSPQSPQEPGQSHRVRTAIELESPNSS